MDSQIQIFEPAGILNATVGNELRRKIKDVLDNDVKVVLIDMKNVTFIDSSGLGALVSAMQEIKKTEKKLFICSINAQVKMLFELTKIERVLNILRDRDEFNRQVMTT
ncbi:STAS domain-containing protein [Anabaena azotica]|uniref:STAS domain-containing protein n=1 Tax=Anabaena azotica TaxID=197653 RepID=UPI0039A43213